MDCVPYTTVPGWSRRIKSIGMTLSMDMAVVQSPVAELLASYRQIVSRPVGELCATRWHTSDQPLTPLKMHDRPIMTGSAFGRKNSLRLQSLDPGNYKLVTVTDLSASASSKIKDKRYNNQNPGVWQWHVHDRTTLVR